VLKIIQSTKSSSVQSEKLKVNCNLWSLAAEADEKERHCDSLIMCIVTTLNEGLRNGGGIGDVLRKPSSTVTWIVASLLFLRQQQFWWLFNSCICAHILWLFSSTSLHIPRADLAFDSHHSLFLHRWSHRRECEQTTYGWHCKPVKHNHSTSELDGHELSQSDHCLLWKHSLRLCIPQ